MYTWALQTSRLQVRMGCAQMLPTFKILLSLSCSDYCTNQNCYALKKTYAACMRLCHDISRLSCQHFALITTVASGVQSHAELHSYLLQSVAFGFLCTVINSRQFSNDALFKQSDKQICLSFFVCSFSDIIDERAQFSQMGKLALNDCKIWIFFYR